MTETIMCPRCGQAVNETKEIVLHGGEHVAHVCKRCHDYLLSNPEALDRFEVLSKEGAPHVEKRNAWTSEMDETLVSMRKAGAKAGEIADALGVPLHSVYNRVKILKRDGAIMMEPEDAKSVEDYERELDKLDLYAHGLMAERDFLLRENATLREKLTAAENTASELCSDLIAAESASARNLIGTTLLDILRLERKKHLDEAERLGIAIDVIERVQGNAETVEDA